MRFIYISIGCLGLVIIGKIFGVTPLYISMAAFAWGFFYRHIEETQEKQKG